MKKHFSLIVFCISVALLVCLYFAAIILYSVTGLNILYSVLFTIAGAVAFYLIHNIIHESFHALFAVLSGGKVTAISFCMFKIDFLRKKVFFKPSAVYAGWTSFLSKKPQNAEKVLKSSLAGGFVGSCLSLIIAALLGLFLRNPFSFAFFVSGGIPACLYMLVVNFVPLVDGNDGSLLFVGGESIAAAAEKIETESNLYLGKPLAEIFPLTLEKKYGKRYPTIYDAWYFLSLKDVGTAKAVLNGLIKNNSDNEVIAPLTERFFIACIENDEKKVNELKEKVECFFDDSEELFALRAHAAYRLFTGEKEWNKAIEKTYRRVSSDYPISGLKKTDNAIFNEYLSDLLSLD